MGNFMKETDSSKILRQVRLYYAFCTIKDKPITPKKAMLEAYIKSHRTFERDLIDLRDKIVRITGEERMEEYFEISEYPEDYIRNGEPFSFPDIIAQYEALFPDASIRTRQRDFQILNRVGKYACLQNEFIEEPDFEIKYDKKFKAYIFFIYQTNSYNEARYIFEVKMIDG